MDARATARLTPAIALAAAGAIAGALLGGPWIWLHYLCKPLTTVLVLWLAVGSVPAQSWRYRVALAAGMVFSLAGDVFLMLPQDLFVQGLVAFLLAHLCFFVAFFPGARWAARLVAVLAYGAIGAANMALLLPKIPQPLHAPVLAYVAVLVVMAGLAAARAWTLRGVPALAQRQPVGVEPVRGRCSAGRAAGAGELLRGAVVHRAVGRNRSDGQASDGEGRLDRGRPVWSELD